MTVPAEIAARLNDEAVLCTRLLELDTSEGFLRFMFGADAYFEDVNGNRWIGSTLVKSGSVESVNNATAPTWEASFSYVHDPDLTDPMAIIRSFGLAAIDGRKARLFFQYWGQVEEMFSPIHAPILIATYTMRRLVYDKQGPRTRMVSVICEGPWALRGKPANGRYTDADQRRRADGDASLEFMPVSGWDETPLFGI